MAQGAAPAGGGRRGAVARHRRAVVRHHRRQHGLCGLRAYLYLSANLQPCRCRDALGDGLITLLRVIVLIALATLIWVPIGVWIGLRPGWPSGCSRSPSSWPPSRPTCCSRSSSFGIVRFGLNSNIWLSPLMILGTQWYILFNVIAGASAFPTDLREVAASLPPQGLALVAAGDPARHLPLLRHRRASPPPAAPGTPASSPRSRAGATPHCRRRASAPISPRRPRPATFRASCSASP